MWRYFLPLALLLALGTLLYAGIGRDPSKLPSPLIGKPAPAFELPVLGDDGRRVSSDTLAGRAYLLNVFASWCATCQAEHPVLKAFAEEGLVPVVGLNWKDRPEDALRWLGRHGNPYEVVLADPSGAIGIDFGVYGTPETFLVDASGTIRFKHVGNLTPEVIDQDIRPLLQQLVGSPQ
jgi:cytochrome c biogenesis protein CcmG/thiol:disulfide interchange protein DsbE